MERDQEESPRRSWSERIAGPIRWRRFTDIDAGGQRAIFFKFELVPGQADLPQEVYDILHSMKHLDRSPERGGGQLHTGLTFNRSKKHGRVWRLNDTPTGRVTADLIDGKLSTLAEKLETEQGAER